MKLNPVSSHRVGDVCYMVEKGHVFLKVTAPIGQIQKVIVGRNTFRFLDHPWFGIIPFDQHMNVRVNGHPKRFWKAIQKCPLDTRTGF